MTAPKIKSAGSPIAAKRARRAKIKQWIWWAGVLFSLLPIVLMWIILKMTGHPQTFEQIVSRGDLYLLAIVLSMASLIELCLAATRDEAGIRKVVAFVGLGLAVIAASVFYGVVGSNEAIRVMALEGTAPRRTPHLSVPTGDVLWTSGVCFVVASVCGWWGIKISEEV